jgi:hypothetical protein
MPSEKHNCLGMRTKVIKIPGSYSSPVQQVQDVLEKQVYFFLNVHQFYSALSRFTGQQDLIPDEAWREPWFFKP